MSAVEPRMQPPGEAPVMEGWARILFDAIDDAVFVHGLDGHILDANPAACRRAQSATNPRAGDGK